MGDILRRFRMSTQKPSSKSLMFLSEMMNPLAPFLCFILRRGRAIITDAKKPPFLPQDDRKG